jgi:Phage integrase, N-terminal/Integrase
MRDLNYALKQLGTHNRDGSYTTQANRARTLSLIADQLYTLGYKQLHATELKGRHVNALVTLWLRQALAPGTIKNRMAALRWWAEKVGRAWVLARDNAHYGIPERQYVTNVSKARTLGAGDLTKVRDPYVRMSLELQRAFGLRRKEAIKFQPAYADRGDRLALKASWAKGGKARECPIRTSDQRAVLERVHQLAGKGSLIPAHRTYAAQLKVYERHTANAGLHKLHGLRHAYAQQRYQELTGWAAPAAGGPLSRELTAAQKALDHEARLTISREMGHEREQITVVYLGR